MEAMEEAGNWNSNQASPVIIAREMCSRQANLFHRVKDDTHHTTVVLVCSEKGERRSDFGNGTELSFRERFFAEGETEQTKESKNTHVQRCFAVIGGLFW